MTPYEAIADLTRRRILDLLRHQEMPAGQVATHFPVSRPAVSKHLRVLRRARLVREVRRGRHRFYRLNAKPLREVDSWVHRYERFWREGLSALKQYLEDEASSERQLARSDLGKE
jgi:DNA-binding transcriptional ArsR family regulator